jgi:hypothetical protein
MTFRVSLGRADNDEAVDEVEIERHAIRVQFCLDRWIAWDGIKKNGSRMFRRLRRQEALWIASGAPSGGHP